jgi:hypothetical protein
VIAGLHTENASADLDYLSRDLVSTGQRVMGIFSRVHSLLPGTKCAGMHFDENLVTVGLRDWDLLDLKISRAIEHHLAHDAVA